MGRWANKYVIGLTGNIAMGKSVVRKMLEHLGAYTIDADGLAHQTMVPGAPAYHPIIDTFGRWILDPDGRINRSKLGAVVFSHPEALARLETITHPVVGKGIDTLVSRARHPIIVIEAIKLIEGALGEQVDAIWVVDTAPQVQLDRLMQKRSMSELEARKRIEGQNPQREKLARANVVITNNGSLQDVWVQVEREWRRLLEARGLKATDDEVRTVKVSQPTAPAQPTPPRPAPVSTAAPPEAPPKPAEDITPPPVAAQPTPPPEPAPAPVTAPEAPLLSVNIRRGMPRNADTIAQLINQVTGRHLTRMDVMGLFGEKSYLMAEFNGKFLGLAGFQVENLITRVDEFIIIPGVPVGPVSEALIQAFEEASKELQSEVGFVFLPLDAPQSLIEAFRRQEYAPTALEAIKVPAWREAAAESQPANTQIFTKKLRAERVLKPL